MLVAFTFAGGEGVGLEPTPVVCPGPVRPTAETERRRHHGDRRADPPPRRAPARRRRRRARTTSSSPAASSGSPSTSPGGVDIGAIGRCHPADLPAARRGRPDPRPFTLEVSSPGPRAPAAHARALRRGPSASIVTVKTRAGVEGDRRFKGTARRRRRRRHHRRARRRRAGDRPGAPRATTRSSGPAPCSSGAPPPSPAAPKPGTPIPVREEEGSQVMSERRHDGGPPGPGRGEGHLARDPHGRAGRRPGVGLQAAARRLRVRLGHHRPRHRRDPRHRPGARRGRRALRPRARRHARPDTSAASPPRPSSR